MWPEEMLIIGGGVIGLTSAVVLARRAHADGDDPAITLLERAGTVGAGSTTRAGCGLRTVYSYPTNVRLAGAGLRFWENAPSLLGTGIEFRRNGYQFLADSSATRRLFRQEAARQRSYGFPATYTTDPELAPPAIGSGYRSGLHSPVAALASPAAIVDGLAATARRLGVDIRTDTAVTGLTETGDTVRVETEAGRFDPSVVVNAAGAWAPELADMIGVSLPVTPRRRRLATVSAEIPADTPLTVDVDTGVYVLPAADGRTHVGGNLLGDERYEPGDPAAFSEGIDPEWVAELRRVGGRLWPALTDVSVTESWTGLYAMTPSRRPIIDRIGDTIHATGFSGHGIMQAPGVAQVIADLVTGESPELAGALAHDRPVQPPDIQF